METALFYIFGGIALIAAISVVAQRRVFYAAISLIVCLCAVAGLYLLLESPFIAAIQIVVYAGAIMVLFLFVIMLLDLKAEERRKIKVLGIVGGLISAGAILAIFLSSLLKAPLGAAQSPAVEGGTVPLAKLLFTQYLLPFEIVSVLLLVAMVGVVLLSKKDVK